jgi:peptidyl-prolyl cis-trans isomerase C
MKLSAAFSRLPIVVRIAAVTILTPMIIVGLSVLLALRITSLPNDAAFRADDAVVTKQQLAKRLGLLRSLYGIKAPDDPGGQDTFRRESAQLVAISTVLDHAVREQGVVVEAKDAHARFEQLIASRFPQGEDQFVKLLGTVGASRQDVMDEITRQLATTQLYDKIVAAHGAELRVSDAEARQYFAQNSASFVVPETRRIRNIVVATESDASGVLAKAQAGADFAQLAKQFSMDPSTRDIGGDLGLSPRTRLDDDYAQAAFAVPQGALFGPVKAKQGWNVGQVTEVHPATPQTFEQVSEQIRNDLKYQKSLAVWQTWLTERIRAADIQYADEYRPASADMPLDPGKVGPAANGGIPR